MTDRLGDSDRPSQSQLTPNQPLSWPSATEDREQHVCQVSVKNNRQPHVKVILFDMSRDAGVQGDYVERAFKADSEDIKFRKRFMRRDQRQKYYEARTDERKAELRTAIEHLEMVQEVRPLKPPGRS